MWGIKSLPKSSKKPSEHLPVQSQQYTTKTSGRRHGGLFIVNFKHISHLFFFADFGQINVSGENATTSDELCSELTQLKPMLS